MNAGRTRILITSLAWATLLTLPAATPVAAACALRAPDSVDVGERLVIEGAGFPGGAAVDVSMAIDGNPADAFAVNADATGAFSISLTPEEADRGVMLVEASDGDCDAASTVYVGVNPPTDGSAGATGQAAGGTDGPPRTDGLAATPAGGDGRPWTIWFVAGALLGLGLGSWFAARRRPAR